MLRRVCIQIWPFQKYGKRLPYPSIIKASNVVSPASLGLKKTKLLNGSVFRKKMCGRKRFKDDVNENILVTLHVFGCAIRKEHLILALNYRALIYIFFSCHKATHS